MRQSKQTTQALEHQPNRFFLLMGLTCFFWAILLVVNLPLGLAQDPADDVLQGTDPADAILEGDEPQTNKQPQQPDYVEEWQDSPQPKKAEPQSPTSTAPPAKQPAPAAMPPPVPAETAPAPPPAPPLTPAPQQAAPPPAAPAATNASEAPLAEPADVADSVLNQAPEQPVAGGAAAAAVDVADDVLAVAATAPAEVTESEYEELRRSYEASVQIVALEAVGEMRDGLLIRRGRKGAKAAPNRVGFSGVYRALSADMPVKDSFRFGTHLGFYRVPNGWDDTTQSHLDTLGFFSYSLRKDLELRIAAAAAGHHSGVIARAGQDALFQTLGDIMLGAKYAYALDKLPYLTVAGAADLIFYTQIGSFLISPKSTSFNLTAAGTVDFLRVKKFKNKVPIRTHANLGYNFNQSSHLFKDNNVGVRNASTFGGFGMAPGDQLPFVAAAEYVYNPWVAFFEYSAEPAVRQRVSGSVISERPSYLRSPHRMTLGGRWNPIENLTLDLALDIAAGFNKPVRIFGRPEPPGPPYTLSLGFSYEWNPQSFEVIDLRGKLAGIVVDAETGQALGGAIIEYLDTDKYTSQIADSQTGSFESYHLPPGEILLRVTVEGYEPAIINPNIPQRQILEEKIFLRKPEDTAGPVGALVGQVVDEEGRPVTATIRFLNAQIEAIVASPSDGSFVKILPEGNYELEVAAAGYETKTYQVPIVAQKKTRVSFQLVSGTMLGALSGQVVDQQGRPVQATIIFLDAQIDPLQTDATGSFSKPLPPGNYGIEVRARGYLPRQFTVPLQQGRKTVLDIQMDEEQAIGAFAGKILSEDGSPIAGIIIFIGTGVAPVPSDPETGSFSVLLDAGSYDISVEAPGFDRLERITIPVLKGKKTVQDFRLKPILKDIETLARLEGNKIVFREPIEFESGSTMLREDAYPILESVAKIFYRLPAGRRLRIEVHTHNLGPADANLRLSQDRAEQVRSFLLSMGLPEDRLEAIGRGEEEPIADNATVLGRDQNERVEITVR